MSTACPIGHSGETGATRLDAGKYVRMRASPEGLSGARGEVAVEDQFLGLNWGVAKNPREHDLGTDLWLMVRDARRFDLGASGRDNGTRAVRSCGLTMT